MSSTPPKVDTSLTTLTPVRFLDSPRPKLQNDQLLTCKTRLDTITKTLLDNFAKWQIAQKRGQSLCNSIEAIKTKCLESKSPGDSLYPEELQPFCDKLAIIFSVFEDILKNTKEALRQLNALAKLQGTSSEIFYRTWFIEDFINFAKTIVERYQAECDVKRFVTEELAHCQQRSDLIRVSSLWEYPCHVDENVKLLFLFLAEELKVK
ncbi:uncharacterized protein LOC129905690 [Episyrphus balteatus]|uniref:uncharacterized protein LOC129905690 n=1 Tax=Episyrphus balteatus TaxID=286459 RepID=UPI0024864D90|nr:uncharacterized protein LOC129905690 [Episyrphus balteatus]